MSKGKTRNSNQSFFSWFEKYYLHLILFFLLIFTLLPVLAPVLVKNGLEYPARLIYWAYSNLCHQLPYRSWFLFGEHTHYPLDTAGLENGMDFISAFQYSGELENSRGIIGSENLGYKIAICQRDLAMYLGLLFIGIAFLIFGKKWKEIPFWVWLVFGVLPLGIDGFSQLAGHLEKLPLNLPLRESTPFLRTITGALFGFFTGLYIYPRMESRFKREI
ncbi:MAG: DUF2085 domain-containing protein [Chloroflexi bacterium]|nr:DUF2085 domain-containing protein [Chloroflexota bacterium]